MNHLGMQILKLQRALTQNSVNGYLGKRSGRGRYVLEEAGTSGDGDVLVQVHLL